MKTEIDFKETITFRVPLDDVPLDVINKVRKAIEKNEIQCFGDLVEYIENELGLDKVVKDLIVKGRYITEEAEALTMDENDGAPTTTLKIYRMTKAPLMFTNSAD